MAIMETSTVQVEHTDEISTLTISRPESLNALNTDVLQGLILEVEKLQNRSQLRVLVLKGAGSKAFVAGADIHSMHQLGPRAIADYVELGQRAMRAIECFEKPVVAAVDGYALGGGLELALAADLILASSKSKLGQPEVNLGIIPGFGGTQRLLLRCGTGAARRLVLSGDIITAEEGFSLGLVDKVFSDEEFEDHLDKYIATLCSKAPLALQEAKRVLRESQQGQLLSGLRMEVEAFLKLFGTADREEGMEAFLAKREPKFQGR